MSTPVTPAQLRALEAVRDGKVYRTRTGRFTTLSYRPRPRSNVLARCFDEGFIRSVGPSVSLTDAGRRALDTGEGQMIDPVRDPIDEYAEAAQAIVDTDVPVCACGRVLRDGDLLYAACEMCRSRLRIPRYRGAEMVSERIRRFYGGTAYE